MTEKISIVTQTHIQKLKKFPEPSTQDIVYCDAAFFHTSQAKHNAILAIVYKGEATRIRARARNGTIAELLSILMARKLYPGRLIINDCKAVTDMFNGVRIESLRHMLGRDSQSEFLMDSINTGGVMWMRRRSDGLSCLVDSLTRRTLGKNLNRCLHINNFTIKELGF